MKYDGVRLDETAQDVLQRIYRSAEREASTRDITDGTDYDKDAVRYRLRRLGDAGIVTTRQSEHVHEGTIATLTNEGREAVEKGLLGNIFDTGADTCDVRQRLNALDHDHDEQARKLRMLGGVVDAIWDALNDANIDIEEYIDDATEREIRAKDR